jgi:hypothetical protein
MHAAETWCNSHTHMKFWLENLMEEATPKS